MSKQVMTATSDPRQPKTLSYQPRGVYSSAAALRILSRLQTTLNPDQVLAYFFEDIQALAGIDGLAWSHAGLGAKVQLGRAGRYRLSYSLNATGQNLGELTVSRRTSPSEAEIRVIEQSLGLLIHPLRNAVMYQAALQAARRDALTGLGNRAALDESLHRELDLARRHGESFALILFDVDCFKGINDAHGHPAGDAVLREIAELMRQSARQSDLLFRYAGDEFVIAMSRTGAEGAMRVADRLRRAVAERRITLDNRDIPVRISLGVAVANGQEDAAALFQRVDQALLDAKRHGRDQVVAA